MIMRTHIGMSKYFHIQITCLMFLFAESMISSVLLVSNFGFMISFCNDCVSGNRSSHDDYACVQRIQDCAGLQVGC